MKISGCTIASKLKTFDYPIVESIKSILPVCDEYIVNIDTGSDDGTRELIESINSPKIKIIANEWDKNFREGGKIYSYQTNIALKECQGDWIVYLQADEVIHEKDLELLKKCLEDDLKNYEIEGFEFNVLHFYGRYDVIQDNYRKWYTKATRVIRNKANIFSWGDALDFRVKEEFQERKLKVKKIPVTIYHYGWCRDPQKMVLKMKTHDKFYHNDDWIEIRYKNINIDNIYSDIGNLAYFKGEHPKVMLERVKNQNWTWDPKIDKQLPRWLRMFLIKYFYYFENKFDSIKNNLIELYHTIFFGKKPK
jgi:glycosyltransferase involved in cell wall biosynthesis